MPTEILITKSSRESRVARLDNGHLVELFIERAKDRGIVGNIYKGRVARVLPGMQAAFIEMGLARTGFLYVSNIIDPEAKDINEDGFDEDGENASSTENESEEPAEPRDRDKALPNISSLIHEGQTILVQVIKEPMGTKGARLSGYISLPGRYLVYLPDTRHIGISRRIENGDERERLRQIIEKNRPAQGGFIVRTVAENATEKHLKDDMDYLVKLWGSIKKNAEKQSAPSLVYSDLDLPSRIIRDRVTDDVDRILLDDLTTFKQITKFIQSFLPRFKKRIELHTDKTPLFELHGIETEITRAVARKVWLKSGGYIIIDETEALTTIDVNTGRFVGRRNLEDTILQTNLEAVKEIAYQIRLRNLGGIIVLDFIDMDRVQNRDRVYQSFLEELRKDPVRTNVLPISQLGLIEMTRKRTQESLRQKLTSACQYCEGKGFVKSRDTVAYEILRECQRESVNAPDSQALAVYCHPAIAEIFAEEERVSIEELEKKLGRRVTIKVDPNLHLEEYEIFARDV
ncbi:MAG: Rne/Rng family ribonuclease [Bdellovibrionales bacterium]|nr:Rne/Rng family ribonuclease [Bdellovibrionales bacterium]